MRLASIVAALVLAFPAPPAQAQPSCRTTVVAFGNAGELRRRAEELTAESRADVSILRSTILCLRDTTRSQKPRVTFVRPDLRLVMNGGLPDSRADGALWAGRGVSSLVRLGVTLDFQTFHLAFVPELWTSANRPFDVQPGLDTTRSSLASPFYAGRYSLDLPSRMGRDAATEFSAGQTALWFSVGPVDLGWSSSNLWWGTGVRDALFIGPTAAGMPRFFVRTPHALTTRFGRISGELFFGELSESRFFDRITDNNRRSLSAATFTWQPRGTDGVVLGIARGVTRTILRDSTYGLQLFDALVPLREGTGDQLTTFFARYHLPRSGLRAYAEVARARTTSSLRDVLTVPSEGIAYQVGIERLVRRTAANWLFLAEAMNLEQGVDVKERPPRDFYSGNGTPQGWTQRGQLLGAGIGPGAQSQWLSADRFSRSWSVGLFAERVRWNNDALYRQYLPYANRHDVTLRLGARAGIRRYGYDVMLDASWGNRLNYLFQNNEFIPSYRTVDVRVPQLHLAFSPVSR